MNYKKLGLFFCTAILISFGIYKLIEFQKGPGSSEAQQWRTFNKVTPQKIESYPTTPEEVEEMHVAQKENPNKKRAPASQKVNPEIEDRPWRGTGPRPLNAEIENKYNPLWKDELGKNLLRFLRPKTKSIIKQIGSALIQHQGKYIQVEQVSIKLKSPEGRHFGYNAYVDSATGKVLKTWNRSIHEPLKGKSLKLSSKAMVDNTAKIQD